MKTIFLANNSGAAKFIANCLHKKGLIDATIIEETSAKTKVLMMVLSDSLLSHPTGVRNLANRARSLGATEGEISETVRVAYLMGGLPGLVTGCNAFPE